MKILLIIIIVLMIIYVGGFVMAYFAQEKIIYPRQLNNNSDSCQEDIADMLVKYNDTILYYKHIENSDIVVVFYHGNGNVVCDMTFVMDILAENDISYVFPEYTGYNNNEHKTTHEDILQNVRDTVDYVNEQGYKHVYVIGQSIGSGAAAHHVSLQSPERLLLITPFTSLTRVIKEMFPIYPGFFIDKFFEEHFNNEKKLRKYNGELIIIHGKKDNVVNHIQSIDLFNKIQSENKELILVDDYGHEEITQTDELKDAIMKIIK